MRVLLAGGRGFISSHLVESLLTVGADLTMVDNVDSFSDLSFERTEHAIAARSLAVASGRVGLCHTNAMGVGCRGWGIDRRLPQV
jgi:nucleoside-diphosphate-sugar epimerase